MEPNLIRVGDTIINPAFVALVLRCADDTVEVHMGAAPLADDLRVLRFGGAAAKRAWAARQAATNPGAEPEGR